MRCPFCGQEDTKVIDSRAAEAGSSVRRRRECERCGTRFSTYERASLPAMVTKRDGRQEPFEVEKVRGGLQRALADREVTEAGLDEIIREIVGAAYRASGPISSEEIGRLALAGLRELDEAAYLRFASVHKGFQDAGDFEREMAALEEVQAPNAPISTSN